MPYYLGIDGGGTKTTCAVGDESRVLATATAGPSNIVRVGELNARESLRQAVLQACAAAGIAPEQIAGTYIGGSGAGHPEVAEIVRKILAEMVRSPIVVAGDMQSALEAAFDNGPGVVVNAGTGSFAYGRNQRGETMRAGGFGFAIGDEGSAQWIGRSAVNLLLRASDRLDGIAETPLAKALFKAWGVSSLADLSRAANSVPPPNFAALSPAVFASDDDVATQVLSAAGRELSAIADVVIGRLFAKDHGAAVPVAMTGGVFRHAPRVRDVFYNELHRIEPRAEINPQVVDPVEGALRMARRAVASRG